MSIIYIPLPCSQAKPCGKAYRKDYPAYLGQIFPRPALTAALSTGVLMHSKHMAAFTSKCHPGCY